MNGINTLYIRNLNEKVSSKTLVNVVRVFFERHGFKVMGIEAHKNLQLKGQCFLTLDSHESCERAIESLNTCKLLEMPLDIYLANHNSDLGDKLRFEHSQEKNWKKKYNEFISNKKKSRSKQKDQLKPRGTTTKRKLEQSSTVNRKRAKLSKQVKNKILLLTDLPDDIMEDKLFTIFEKFKGFLNVNLVKIRHLAIVEFASDDQAAVCLESFGGIVKIGSSSCQLQYGKK